MARIAVAGSTGTIGKLICKHITSQGHTVVPLSRGDGVDLSTGKGLAEALSPSTKATPDRGAERDAVTNTDDTIAQNDKLDSNGSALNDLPSRDQIDGGETPNTNTEPVLAIIDASQVASPMDPNPVPKLLKAAENLNEAARTAGIQRLVMLSINGVQHRSLREAFVFYQARWEQERLVLGLNEPGVRHDERKADVTGDGATEHAQTKGIVVRSVQWYEFAFNSAGTEMKEEITVRSEGEEVTGYWYRVQDWAIQPAAMDSVAKYLVDVGLGKEGVDDLKEQNSLHKSAFQSGPETEGDQRAVAAARPAPQSSSPEEEHELENRKEAGIITVAGSERMTLPQMTQRIQRSRNRYERIEVVRAPANSFEDGCLFAPDHAVILKPSLDEWLEVERKERTRVANEKEEKAEALAKEAEEEKKRRKEQRKEEGCGCSII